MNITTCFVFIIIFFVCLFVCLFVCFIVAQHFTGELKFFYFSEEYIPEFIKFIKEKNLVESYLPHAKCLHATGGGAYGYKKLIQKELGIKVRQHVNATLKSHDL